MCNAREWWNYHYGKAGESLVACLKMLTYMKTLKFDAISGHMLNMIESEMIILNKEECNWPETWIMCFWSIFTVKI